MPSQVLVFDDFTGGEYGALSPRRAPRNSFTGTNVLVYRDGSIGPRAGLKQLTVTGTPGNIASNLRDLAGNPAKRVVQLNGTGATGFNPDDQTTAAYTGAFAVAATGESAICPVANTAIGAAFYVAIAADKIYKLDPTALTIAAVAGSPAAFCLAKYGSRLAAGGNNTVGNRLFFSDPLNFDSWPALNYVDIGPDPWQIVGLWAQRDHLTIALSDGSWWVVTGTLGVNEVVRRVVDGPNVGAPRRGIALPNGEIWFVPIQESYLAVFTGSEVRLRKQFNFLPTAHQTYSVGTTVALGRGSDPDDVIIVDPNGPGNGVSLLIRHNGVWTKHTTTTGKEPTFKPAITALENGVILINRDGLFDTNQLLAMDLSLERPPYATPTYTFESRTDLGASMPADFALPLWQHPQCHDVTVQKVAVDFRKWATTGSDLGFTVAVDAYSAWESAPPKASGAQSFTEAAGSSLAGVAARQVFGFGDQGPGHGFVLRFTGLQGVAIDSITVVIDEADRSLG